MDKAAALKGNIDVIIARQREEQENDETDGNELREPPTLGASGKLFPFK